MEFANLIMNLYSQKYGVKSDWFSDQAWFNNQIDEYNVQKKEIKDIVSTF